MSSPDTEAIWAVFLDFQPPELWTSGRQAVAILRTRTRTQTQSHCYTRGSAPVKPTSLLPWNRHIVISGQYLWIKKCLNRELCTAIWTLPEVSSLRWRTNRCLSVNTYKFSGKFDSQDRAGHAWILPHEQTWRDTWEDCQPCSSISLLRPLLNCPR